MNIKQESLIHSLLKALESNGGTLSVNPLALWGRSRMWRGATKAKWKGFVEVQRLRPDLAAVTLTEFGRQELLALRKADK